MLLLLRLLLLMHLLARLGTLVDHLLRLLLPLRLRRRRRDGLVGIDERLVVEVEHDAPARRLFGRGALRHAVYPQRLPVDLDRHLSHFAAVLLKHVLHVVLDLGSRLLLLRVLLGLLLLLLLPVLLLLMGVPNRLLLRRLLGDRAVVQLLLRLPHNALLDTLTTGRPERGHGGLRGRRLHRHRPAPPRRRVLQGHDPDRLPVGHLHHAAGPWRLLEHYLLATLQHQHPRLPSAIVGRPQDLPYGLLNHDAVLLLRLLGMVLDVLDLLLLRLLVHHHPRLQRVH